MTDLIGDTNKMVNDSLVERVSLSIDQSIEAHLDDIKTAQWVIKTVAKWLEEREDDYFSYTDAFELLRRQAND
jgi:hypothetical protein